MSRLDDIERDFKEAWAAPLGEGDDYVLAATDVAYLLAIARAAERVTRANDRCVAEPCEWCTAEIRALRAALEAK